MTDATAVIEAILLRYGDTSTSGRTVTLQLHKEPGSPHPFEGLRCGASNGQRMAVSIALISDDESERQLAGAEPVQPQAVSAEAAPTMKGERSDSCSQHIHAGPHQADNPSPSGGDRRKWDELPYSQQAAIRCREPEFIKWLFCMNATDAAERVRRLCGVKSRAEILPGTPAGDEWAALDSDFMLHRFGAMT